MARYFSHYWRNDSVDDFVNSRGADDAHVGIVYGDNKLLKVGVGDYLYEVTVKDGLLHLLCRLEVEIVEPRRFPSPFAGERESDHQEYQATAFTEMRVHPEDVVPPEITRQIRCIDTDGNLVPLKMDGDILDNQTLRNVRELTEASAALLDRAIAEYELKLVSADEVQECRQEIAELQDEEGGYEGAQSSRLVNHYERDAGLRAAAVRIHGTRCMACGFSFEEAYGELGAGYIEVHHLRPISTYGKAVYVNPLSDMAVLCSNCHRMIHRSPDGPLSVLDLRAAILNAHDG